MLNPNHFSQGSLISLSRFLDRHFGFLWRFPLTTRSQTSVPRFSNIPSEGAGVFDTVAGTAVDGFVHYGLPWMGKKAVEMGQYGASELMRNKNLQKKAVNYGISKLTPFIQDSVGLAMDELSTKVRPNKKYKTDRPELDGKGIDVHKWIGKLPKPKAGWTPGSYKYMGPYNPLDKQLSYDPETGK